ncbi:hypothetical protein [Sinorhizobium meliloti]|jgi:hypothetical protein|nr:hypothetical protein [Sinorhizobium meliloti]
MNGSTNAVIVTAPATVCGKLVLFVINTSDLGRTSHPRAAIRSRR